jgi:outer membrane protein
MRRLFLITLACCALARGQELPEVLDLAGAEALALRHNPRFAQIQARLVSATSQMDAVVAESLPLVRALADASYDDRLSEGGGGAEGGGGDSFSDPEFWNAEIRADVPLLSSGRLDARKTQTGSLVRAEAEQGKATAAQVLREVRQAFLAARLAAHRVAVQESSLDLLAKQAEDNQRRHAAGVLPRLALLQAQVAVENARPELQRAQREQRLAIDALMAAMGLALPPGRDALDVRLAAEWPVLPEPAASLEDCLRLARAQRAELRALDAELAAARASADYEKRLGYPDFDGFGRYGVDNNTFEEGEDVRTGWMVGVTFSLPLIDAGRVKSKVRDAEARQAEILARRETEWLRMEAEIREIWSARELAMALSQTADARVGLAEETLKLAVDSQSNGRATQLDVLQADLGLTRARLDRLAAEHDRLRALADLAYAVGIE